MVEDEKHIGPGQPGGAGIWGEPTPFAEAVRKITALNADWESRPEVIETRRLREEGEARRRAERLRAKGNLLYGPPDPRKGRPPMTR